MKPRSLGVALVISQGYEGGKGAGPQRCARNEQGLQWAGGQWGRASAVH